MLFTIVIFVEQGIVSYFTVYGTIKIIRMIKKPGIKQEAFDFLEDMGKGR